MLLMHISKSRGVAQFGSALVSGTRGREFESRRPDQFKSKTQSDGCVFLLYAESKNETPKIKKKLTYCKQGSFFFYLGRKYAEYLILYTVFFYKR